MVESVKSDTGHHTPNTARVWSGMLTSVSLHYAVED